MYFLLKLSVFFFALFNQITDDFKIISLHVHVFFATFKSCKIMGIYCSSPTLLMVDDMIYKMLNKHDLLNMTFFFYTFFQHQMGNRTVDRHEKLLKEDIS